MRSLLTPVGRHYRRPASLAAGVLLLHTLATPASAQLLAANLPLQSTPAPAPTSLVSLKTLLKQWEGEYHATIFYESNVVDNKRVAVPSEPAASLAERLAAVLPSANLQFKELRPNYFVVTSRLASATGSAAAVAPQNVPVSGRVTDAKGEGLPGVTVLVKGTTLGTSTGADGSFSLSVPENSTLVFSSIGYKNQEIAVTGATSSIAIRLSDDQQSLNEVVVVGYGTQTRQDLSTSVASVGAAALARQPVAGFDQALQGQAPGVQVTTPSGAPGAGINVRVRGASTLNLNASPLYVIDGVPVLPDYQQEINQNSQRLNPLNTINPDDIESIDVLKDGAAAAIYGVRAANGVVVITTKRGKVGQAQVGITAYFGRQYLRKKLDVLNAQQFASEFNQIQSNAGLAPAFVDPNNPVSSDPAAPGPYNTDWQDAIYRPANIQNYQLNVSGGTEKTRYYVSGGYFNQQGINLNSGFDRYNFKINLTQELSKRFRVGTNLNLSRSNTNSSVRSEAAGANGGTVLGALSQIPTIPVYKPSGIYGTNPFSQSDNPVGNLLETSNKAVVYQTVGNIYGEFDILSNLRVRTNLGIDFRNQGENYFQSTNYPGTSNADASTKGRASTAANTQVIWLNENTITWNPTFGEKHHLTLLGGESMQESFRNTAGATTQGFNSNIVPNLDAGSAAVGLPYSYQDSWSLLSYFARANYDYDGKYLLQASVRADGTSRFTNKYRFGYFPAVSAAWRISKENFFPQNNTVSDLKLRASFGANGNQEIYTYQRFPQYSLSGLGYQGTGSTIVGGASQTTIGNNDLHWETTYQYNAGLDIGMFNNRLTLNVDVYNKQTRDLLLQVPIAVSTGAQTLSVLQNLGSIENKGLEIGLTTTNVEASNGGFGWTTSLNVSGNRNNIRDLGTRVSDAGIASPTVIINGAQISQAGYPLGAFYGYISEGIVQSDAEGATLATQNGVRPKAGDIKFKDISGPNGKPDGIINGSDQTIIGNPNPKAFAGVTNNFSFKGLELSVFFQGQFGNEIYNQTRQILESQSDPNNQTTRVLNHWSPTNTNTDIPRPVRNDPAGNNRFSNRWLEDGSYVRLKNLTLAYTIPTAISRHAAIQNLRVYVTGQNLITWTHYLGYDPEVSANPFSTTNPGVDYGVYPQSRTYTVGLNATF